MDKHANSKNHKRKFKQTKQLIRLALNDGWSQVDIAEKCRTQQSVVSAWSKGTKFGTEQQLKSLLEIFGHKLRRNSFRVYWSFNSDTLEKTFYKVEGKVVLSHVLNDARSSGYRKVVKIPQKKLIVHHQGENKFRIVMQNRIKVTHENEALESSVEDAIWTSEVMEQCGLVELLDIIDDYSEKKLNNYPGEATTLPFITRQALLNHGFNVEGVVEYPAAW